MREVGDLTESELLTEEFEKSEMPFRDLDPGSHGHYLRLYPAGNQLAILATLHAISIGFSVILSPTFGIPVFRASSNASGALASGVASNFPGTTVCVSACQTLNVESVNN